MGVQDNCVRSTVQIQAPVFHDFVAKMSETKAISVSPVVSDSDLNKNVKDASSVAVEPSSPGAATKTSLWRKIVGLVWDSVEGDPEYRKYVQRLDTFFLYGLLPFNPTAIFPLLKSSQN